jgi:ABC-type dipeptide/oligopeptide/nickel transport system ATPase component
MLEVKNLSVDYVTDNKVNHAVSEVSFTVAKGESLGVVGESGSGKSTVAYAIMKLIVPPGRITGGEMVKSPGTKIAMIFQDPFTSLNPVFTVGEQVAETIRQNQGLNSKLAWEKAIELLEIVKIKDAGQRVKDYPHQFSGGMRQRVMIAIALSCQPELLIADEPTTALDIVTQDEILKLLAELQQKLQLAIIFITHNFKIVRQICDRVVVMKNGKIVEEGKVEAVFSQPRTAYTKQLVDCLRIIEGRS